MTGMSHDVQYRGPDMKMLLGEEPAAWRFTSAPVAKRLMHPGALHVFVLRQLERRFSGVRSTLDRDYRAWL